MLSENDPSSGRTPSGPFEIRVRLFAAAKQILGVEFAAVPLLPPHDVSSLKTQLALRHPLIASLVAQSRLAVNAAYASPEQRIDPRDEVALIPPVSGG